MKNQNLAIDIQNVTKKYVIHYEKPTMVETFIKKPNKSFNALTNVSLKIYHGEKIGIIGPNGAGKTTLLKIISGITTPTSGHIKTNGRIVSLIDLEAGFHPELSGAQNIYLNGMLLGMSRTEIKNKMEKIIDMADLNGFIDVPLFTYSDGMKLKLGFSIAINADPEILILDEGIWAGDLKFQKLSSKKIGELFKMNKTIIIATHWLDYIRKNCNRVILIKNGKVVKDGSTKVISSYINA